MTRELNPPSEAEGATAGKMSEKKQADEECIQSGSPEIDQPLHNGERKE